MGFKIGDRVRCVSDYGVVKINDTGTYLGKGRTYMISLDAAIEWDKPHRDMHSCNGKCASMHGWYIPEACITHDGATDLGPFLYESDERAKGFLLGLQ